MRVLAALLLLLAGTVQAHALRLLGPDYWCPFSCTQGATRQGFAIDILRAVLQPLGYDIRFANMNYSRALLMLRQGHYDAIAAVFPAEAPDLLFSKEAIARNRYCVYARPDSRWAYRQPADLAGKRTGMIRGYDYGPRLNAWRDRQGARIELHSGDLVVPRMLDKVRLGRLDALVEDENVVDWLQDQQPLPLRKAGCEASSWSYLAVSPHYPQARQLLDDFDHGMPQLRQSGKLAAIMADYGLKGW